MSPKSSTFIDETRKRETWLRSLAGRDGLSEAEADQLLSTAALIRGTIESIPVPEDSEERSRAQAVAHMLQLREQRAVPVRANPPWHVHFQKAMQFVFTLGKRR